MLVGDVVTCTITTFRWLVFLYLHGYIKVTVQRDFVTPVFCIKRLILFSIGMPKSYFEFFRIFVESLVLKVSKIQLPAVTDNGESKIEL